MLGKLRKLDTLLKGVCVLGEKFLPMGMILGIRWSQVWVVMENVHQSLALHEDKIIVVIVPTCRQYKEQEVMVERVF